VRRGGSSRRGAQSVRRRPPSIRLVDSSGFAFQMVHHWGVFVFPRSHATAVVIPGAGVTCRKTTPGLAVPSITDDGRNATPSPDDTVTSRV